MLGVGCFRGFMISAAVAGSFLASSAFAATVTPTMVGALVDDPLLLSLGDPGASSAAIPDFGGWFDQFYNPVAKVAVSGSDLTPPTYRSPFDGMAWEDSAKYWSTGINGSPSENYPNPGFLVFKNQHSGLQFLWGSVDTFNSISFWIGHTLIDTVTGSDILALGGITEGDGAVLIQFASDVLFDRVQFFSDTENAFEIANIQVNDSNIPGVPLPSAVLLLGSAFGGLGFVGLRRRKASS